jgi:hypothetical protein
MSGPNQQRGWNTPHEKSRLMMPRAAPPESATPLKFLGWADFGAQAECPELANGGTVCLPTRSLCFLARVSHRRRIRLPQKWSTAIASVRGSQSLAIEVFRPVRRRDPGTWQIPPKHQSDCLPEKNQGSLLGYTLRGDGLVHLGNDSGKFSCL